MNNRSRSNLPRGLPTRRIIVKLDKKTRNGDDEIRILTNLEKDAADAIKIADIYRERWEIETAFQRLEGHFHSEINTLGYPKAAFLWHWSRSIYTR